MEHREQDAYDLLFDTVFSDIAESPDARYSPRIRNTASRMLEHNPQYEANTIYHALHKVISGLRHSRIRVAPVFGGMIVTHELLRISGLFQGEAAGFITSTAGDPSPSGATRIAAVEELLYGYSAEQLQAARRVMYSRGERSVSRERIGELLRTIPRESAYHAVARDGVEEGHSILADFRLRRRRARERRAGNTAGPDAPLEELLAAYLIGHTQETSADSEAAHV